MTADRDLERPRELPEDLRVAVLRAHAARRVREALERPLEKPIRIGDVAEYRIRRL